MNDEKKRKEKMKCPINPISAGVLENQDMLGGGQI